MRSQCGPPYDGCVDDEAQLSLDQDEIPGNPVAPVLEEERPLRRQPPPLWTAFLTPGAVVLGAAMIAAAIWLRWDGREAKVDEKRLVALVAAQLAPPASSAGDGAGSGGASSAQTIAQALTGYAQQLGLDTTKFQQCLARQDHVAALNRQLQQGVALGVQGTPTFFINNKKLVGAQPAAIFAEILAAELDGSPTTLEGYSAAVRALASTSPPRFEIAAARPDVSGAEVEGSRDARVFIAEFSDFQCPFCRRWTLDTLPALRGEVGKDVALAFLHFPITQIHPNAGNASVAGICAGEQGKFWAMHDLLFARQDEWAPLRPQ